MRIKQPFFANLLGCAALLFWAFGAVFTVYIKTLPTFEILSIVFSISFGTTVIYLTVTKSWHKMKQPFFLWIIGTLGIYGNDLLYLAAFKHAPAVQADLINYLWPVLTLLLASFLPKEKLTYRHFLACLLGFMGVYLILTGGKGLGGFEIAYLPGYLFALLEALIWSIYTVTTRHYVKRPVEIIGMYCGVGMAVSLLIHFTTEATVIPSLGQATVLFLMGLTTQGLAYFFWDYAAKKGDLKLLSILAYSSPMLSVFLLILFGYAEATFLLFVACSLVTLGAFIAKSKKTTTKAPVANHDPEWSEVLNT